MARLGYLGSSMVLWCVPMLQEWIDWNYRADYSHYRRNYLSYIST